MAPSAFQWATFGLAAGGLVVGLCGLVWQAVTFSFTGVRVRVETESAVAGLSAGEPDLCVTITARNVGRSSVSITNLGFLVGGQQFFPLWGQGGPAFGPNTPHTLDGGHAAVWLIPLRLFAREELLGSSTEIRPAGFVGLGTGKRVVGNEHAGISTTLIRSEAESFGD